MDNKKMCELFEQFWKENKSHFRIDNPTRTYKRIADRLSGDDPKEALDEYLRRYGSSQTGEVIRAFMEYAEDSGLYLDKETVPASYDSPLERRLAIAKELHEPCRPDDLKEKYRISDRTLRGDISALRNGLEVMGAVIKLDIDLKEDGRLHCRSTVHPVFLPLNLTEVYALAVYMNQPKKIKGAETEIFRNISQRIKSQLSPYARKKLMKAGDAKNRDIEKSNNDFVGDDVLSRQRENVMMYLMKSGRKCRFFYRGEEATGSFNSGPAGYYIQLDDGTVIREKLEDVEFIIESVEYY